MRILRYYNGTELCTEIKYDYSTGVVQIQNYTDDLLLRAFGINEYPSIQDLDKFLRSRCFPESRDKKKLLLRSLGVDYYDPLEIIKKTEGRMVEDDQWLEIGE